MSGRSGYIDDIDDDPLRYGRWRSAVRNALNGRRGQAFLREMLAALDALPEQRLIADDLVAEATGMPFRLRTDVCALGAVGLARGVDLATLDPYDSEGVAGTFGIADAMAREIADINDDYRSETPEQRFARVRAWVAKHIRS